MRKLLLIILCINLSINLLAQEIIEKQTPDTITTGYTQGNEVLFTLHKYDEIIRRCTPPQTSNDYFFLASALDKQGKTLQAIHILEEEKNAQDTLKTYPNNLLKADLYYKTGQFQKAFPYYASTSRNNDSFKKMMKILESKGNYTEVIDSINQRLKNDSTNLDLLQILASCYYHNEATILSANTYEKIYSLNPNDLTAVKKLSVLYVNSKEEKNLSRALELTENVLKRDSDNKYFIQVKGRACFIMNNFQCAYPCFKKLFDEGNESFSICKYLGISEYKIFKYKESLFHLLKAFAINPVNPQINLFIGRSYLELEQTDEALKYLNSVDSLLLPSNETMAILLWEKYRCYQKLKSYEKADTILHKITKYDNNPYYYFFIASNYENGLKNKKQALNCYEKFMTLSDTPKSKNSLSSLRGLATKRIEKLKEDGFWGKNEKE